VTELPESLWSHERTANFLDIPESALYQLRIKRRGPRAYMVGKRLRYDPRDVMSWLNANVSRVDQETA
jgi:hypothetical protein